MNMQILEDIRVLDLSHAMAGPMCSMFLGALGAEIIKIEPPWGEISRFNPPLVNQLSPYFAYTGRQKMGITLNLKDERGKDLFKKLVKTADVVLENYSPGAMERLGLNYEVLKGICPKIIYASISGFGQYGPWSKRHSFNPIAQASSGYMELAHEFMELDSPKVAPEAIADTIPALFCLGGILAALYNRERTGLGQMIDVSQLDSMFSVFPSVTYFTMANIFFGKSVGLRTNFGGTYRCKDGYIQVSVPLGRISDRFLAELKKETGKEDIDRAFFEEWVKEKNVEDVDNFLVNAKVPVAPVLTIEKALKNPQILAREMVLEFMHPQYGMMKSPGFPIKFSETPGKIDTPSPLLGQHNEKIFSGLLGLSKKEIKKLKAEGVI